MTRKRFQKLMRALATDYYLRNPYGLEITISKCYRTMQDFRSDNYARTWRTMKKVLS